MCDKCAGGDRVMSVKLVCLFPPVGMASQLPPDLQYAVEEDNTAFQLEMAEYDVEKERIAQAKQVRRLNLEINKRRRSWEKRREAVNQQFLIPPSLLLLSFFFSSCYTYIPYSSSSPPLLSRVRPKERRVLMIPLGQCLHHPAPRWARQEPPDLNQTAARNKCRSPI